MERSPRRTQGTARWIALGLLLAAASACDPGADGGDSAALQGRLDALEAQIAKNAEVQANAAAEAAGPAASGAAGAGAEAAPRPDVMGSAESLFAAAEAALERKDADVAYRYLVSLHALYPDHDLDADAYRVAASLFVRRYNRTRHNEPDSPWVTVEPRVMFDWLASYYDRDAREPFTADLVRGGPFGLLQQFLDFAARDRRTKDWDFAWEKDNGIVVAIVPHPRGSSPPAVEN